MSTAHTIECHTCGDTVKLSRSVMLRQMVGMHWNSPRIEFGFGDAKPTGVIFFEPSRPPGLSFRDDAARRITAEQGVEGLDCPVMAAMAAKKTGPWTPQEIAYMEQHRKTMTYRRAFVCCACYAAMDRDGCGCCVVARDGKARLFGLAGASRGDKAATVNVKQFAAFQRRIAKRAGFSLDAIEGRTR